MRHDNDWTDSDIEHMLRKKSDVAGKDLKDLFRATGYVTNSQAYDLAEIAQAVVDDEIRKAKLGQPKRHSWYETFMGTSTGFLGSLLITFVVFIYVPGPLSVKAWANTAACTLWSIVRGYYNRRFWNWKHTR